MRVTSTPAPTPGAGARRYAGKVDWTCRDPAVFAAVASPSPNSASKPPSSISPGSDGGAKSWWSFTGGLNGSPSCSAPTWTWTPSRSTGTTRPASRSNSSSATASSSPGLTQCQARRTDALTFQVNASLTAVSLSKLQAVQIHGHLPTPFSMASLVRRAFNAHFLQKIWSCKFSSDK